MVTRSNVGCNSKDNMVIDQSQHLTNALDSLFFNKLKIGQVSSVRNRSLCEILEPQFEVATHSSITDVSSRNLWIAY